MGLPYATLEDHIALLRRLQRDTIFGDDVRQALVVVADIAESVLRPEVARTGRVHDLKTWPEFFEEVISGRKVHEIRENDRDFRVGDALLLREYKPPPAGPFGGVAGDFTGRYTVRLVTYVTPGGKWRLPDNICVMSIAPHPEPLPMTDGERA